MAFLDGSTNARLQPNERTSKIAAENPNLRIENEQIPAVFPNLRKSKRFLPKWQSAQTPVFWDSRPNLRKKVPGISQFAQVPTLRKLGKTAGILPTFANRARETRN